MMMMMMMMTIQIVCLFVEVNVIRMFAYSNISFALGIRLIS